MDDGSMQVEIDSDFEPIIPDFMASRRKDCELLGQLLAAGDMEAISRLGHRLRGAGGSYGFDAISEMGSALEQSAATGDSDAIAATGEQLRSYLDNVRIVYC